LGHGCFLQICGLLDNALGLTLLRPVRKMPKPAVRRFRPEGSSEAVLLLLNLRAPTGTWDASGHTATAVYPSSGRSERLMRDRIAESARARAWMALAVSKTGEKGLAVW
jgi:hypothetical protein